MPRPRSLTPDQIAAAALAVIDRDGPAALSMRAVAAELGMGTMSLYRYVDDRDQLEELVVDHVLDAVDLLPPPVESWTERLATVVERMRGAVHAHPDSIPLLLRHRHASAASLRCIEAMLGVLSSAGFTGKQRALGQRAVIAYLLGALQNEHYGPLSGAGTSAMAALPVEQYPLLGETADAARGISPDEEFAHGLRAMLQGVAAWLDDDADTSNG